ncbi:hypothetical protein ACHAXS_001038 [Conticribra weissflogii]
MPLPPQLYFAKWVRLMFRGEVARRMKDVMRLWDTFFDFAAITVSVDWQAQVLMGAALMNILKSAAASMILLIRDKLLQPTMASNGTMTGEPDLNDGIGYLMNYPLMEDIWELVKKISNLLVKERKLSKQPVASKTMTLPPMAASSRNGRIRCEDPLSSQRPGRVRHLRLSVLHAKSARDRLQTRPLRRFAESLKH